MKKRVLVVILIATAALATASAVFASIETHRAAAESLTTLLQMETMLQQSYEQIIDVQIQGNPALHPYRQVMLDFFAKHMSWASLKDEMLDLYVESFTEDELLELAEFYRSPVGQKAVQVMPELMRRGSEVGSRRVQEHLPELERMIREQQDASAAR
jgi:hypothetical protein